MEARLGTEKCCAGVMQLLFDVLGRWDSGECLVVV